RAAVLRPSSSGGAECRPDRADQRLAATLARARLRCVPPMRQRAAQNCAVTLIPTWCLSKLKVGISLLRAVYRWKTETAPNRLSKYLILASVVVTWSLRCWPKKRSLSYPPASDTMTLRRSSYSNPSCRALASTPEELVSEVSVTSCSALK